MSTPAARLLIDPDRVLNWSPTSDRVVLPAGPGRERAAARHRAAAVGLVAAITVVLLAARQENPLRTRLLGAFAVALRDR